MHTRPSHAEPVARHAGETRAPKSQPHTLGNVSQHDYNAVLDALWINRHNVERLNAAQAQSAPKLSLEPIAELLHELGNPHHALRCVHVAGSKGKGSICEMVAASLQGCGYTVGIYTSPHLVDLRERVRVLFESSDQPISREAFVTLGAKILDAAAQVDARNHKLGKPMLSAFELLTALALTHFAELAVDVAVIEVGLGGTFDATNIITPAVCALGHIQLEHAHVLGPTLADIALHKAGIMKQGVPAFSVPQVPEVEHVFASRAAAVGAPLKFLGKDIEFTHRFQNAGDNAPRRGPHHKLALMLPTRTYEHVPVPLPGEHQAANCALALAVLESLASQGFSLPEGQVVEGLSRTPAIGRMELIHQKPRVLIDGAHTPQAVQALMRTLGGHLKFDSLVVVFGCNDDKDAAGMLQALSLGADKVILTKAVLSSRAIEPKELLKVFNEVNDHPHLALTAPCVKDAINLAHKSVGRNDVILVTGSFAIAGEAKKLFQDKFAQTSTEIKPS
ncbi:MAG: folylpolyglutamate synthase/dihydrofolate synthase family protein [Phycisphaerales bacterium]